jgi:hypothetical protein
VGRSIESIADQVKENTPFAIVELIVRQLDRADEAAARIEREGSVVRDLKGSVVPHPAITVEKDATKIAADLLEKHKAPRRIG